MMMKQALGGIPVEEVEGRTITSSEGKILLTQLRLEN